MPLREQNQFGIDVNELETLVSDRTKMIIINSPANPTGGVLGVDDLKAIAKVAQERDLLVLADEIYSRIIYEGGFFSIASLPGMQERTVILDGFSKTYAMTGWRLGYGVMPEKLAEHVTRLVINATSCTATFTQYAGAEALDGPQDTAEDMVAAFRQRRDVIVEGLNSIPGFRCLKPRGAFYVFPNTAGTGMNSKELEQFLLHEAGVATLAGTSFGCLGQGHMRLSYANSIENISKALSRIDAAIRRAR
jgi:aspartate/methionine/tyrosine aminotransferase